MRITQIPMLMGCMAAVRKSPGWCCNLHARKDNGRPIFAADETSMMLMQCAAKLMVTRGADVLCGVVWAPEFTCQNNCRATACRCDHKRKLIAERAHEDATEHWDERADAEDGVG
jgi:hypothetical protein